MEVQGELAVAEHQGWWPSRTQWVTAIKACPLLPLVMGGPMTLVPHFFMKWYRIHDIPTIATRPSLMEAGGSCMMMLAMVVALHAVAWRVANGGRAWEVKNVLIFMVASTLNSWWYFSRLAAAHLPEPVPVPAE